MQVDTALQELTAAQLLPPALQKALLEHMPANAEELAAVPGMPAPVAQHYCGIIFDAVRACDKPSQCHGSFNAQRLLLGIRKHDDHVAATSNAHASCQAWQ